MKSFTLFISIILLVLISAACGSTVPDTSDQMSAAESVQAGDLTQEEVIQQPEVNSESPAGDSDESQPAGQTTQEPEFNREMSLAMTLALGTFKLEETGIPVDTGQAAEMLTLWKAARSLSESDTTAVEELDAVVKQIQGILTSDQLVEIEAMQLSFQDMDEIAEQMGIEFGFGGGGRFEDMTPEQQAAMQAARESGQFPGGGFGGGPGGGTGGGPGGEGLSPEQRETAIAERGSFQRVNLGLPGPMLDAVIELLEAKAG